MDIIMRIFSVMNVKILIVSNVLVDLYVLNVQKILYYMQINVFITLKIRSIQINYFNLAILIMIILIFINSLIV